MVSLRDGLKFVCVADTLIINYQLSTLNSQLLIPYIGGRPMVAPTIQELLEAIFI